MGRYFHRALWATAAVALLAGCHHPTDPQDAVPIETNTGDTSGGLATKTPEKPMAIKVESTAFDANASIPTKYTCEGANVSVPLSWSKGPKGTKSYVLIVDDPDAPDPKAPKMTWIHWVLFDIPAETTSLAEGLTAPPKGARDGLNSWKKAGWGGPCPPIGRHRYFFKVYALDTMLTELEEPTKAAVEAAMKGHIVGQGELVGTYQKTTK